MAQKPIGKTGTARGTMRSESDVAVRIERDAQLSLILADTSTTAFLGRDYELSLLAIATQPSSIKTSSDGSVIGPTEVEVETVYRETGKIRLSHAAAVHLAMNLLFAVRQSEPETFSEIEKNFERMRSFVLPIGGNA